MESRTCVPRYLYRIGRWQMKSAAFGIPFRMKHLDTGDVVFGPGAFALRAYMMACGAPMQIMRRVPDDSGRLGPMSGVWEPYQDGDNSWPYRDPGAPL